MLAGAHILVSGMTLTIVPSNLNWAIAEKFTDDLIGGEGCARW